MARRLNEAGSAYIASENISKSFVFLKEYVEAIRRCTWNITVERNGSDGDDSINGMIGDDNIIRMQYICIGNDS